MAVLKSEGITAEDARKIVERPENEVDVVPTARVQEALRKVEDFILEVAVEGQRTIRLPVAAFAAAGVVRELRRRGFKSYTLNDEHWIHIEW